MDGSSDAVHLAYVRAGYAALVVVLLLLGADAHFHGRPRHAPLPATQYLRIPRIKTVPVTVHRSQLGHSGLMLCWNGCRLEGDVKGVYSAQVWIGRCRCFRVVLVVDSGRCLYSCWEPSRGRVAGRLFFKGSLYRCYLVWQDIWWVMVFPAVTFLAFVAQGIAFLATSSAPGQPAPYALASAWYILSAVFNITVTGLIVGRLMHARYQVSKLVTLVDMRLYTGPVAILVESALPLCLAAIAAAIVNLPQVAHPAGSFFTSLWVALSSFCPQLIIFRVASGHSYTGENVVRSLKLEDFESLELRANSNSD
ncbi:hypothetical protein CC1G_07660 [Coprinopsis cinerea okayama7|uniref:Uncharacterized protein n=1 Tax=Coprinopsis cinerea (strain Okayama-7 / 130 / ATCC MYA-4618 / FGSC 9003) TaxID=240176 RepID=A8NC56_COPC7|nr:hypothetical protein CC1G_07660 [Coprinopsis cinerea okayama7\|eukprot:XP_001832400.2 hypothetical protein CC1G_07660 [Coprinopsis cinerea okayama7\